MKSNRNRLIAAGIIVLVLLSWFLLSGENEAQNDIIVSPERGEFRVSVTATGELQAKKSTQIYGPRNARMARIYQMKISKLVPEGTVVTEGDFVAELDRAEIANKIKEKEIEIQKAKAEFTQAKLDTTLTLSQARDDLINLDYALEEKKLNKEQSTYEAPSIRRQAEIEHEKATRAFEQAKKNYKTKVQQAAAKMGVAEANLSEEQHEHKILTEVMQQFTISAPADGMVIYDKEWNGRKKIVGSQISSWDPVVAELPDLSVMESVTYVNEVDIQKVQVDQVVSIGLDADPDKSLTGKVTEIANIGEQRPNSDSKVFEVKILVNETDSTLRPSMTTSNLIVVADFDDVLSVPLECIHAQDSLTFVYKKSRFKTTKQEVMVGMVNENNAIVEAGLSEKDKVYLSVPENGDAMSIDYLPSPDESQQAAK